MKQIKELYEQGAKYGDIAILYRAHYVSRGIEDEISRSEIPYRIYNGVAFYARAEVKDVLAYLRLIQNLDDLSFQRIANTPRRRLGKKTMSRLREFAEENGISMWESLLENKQALIRSGDSGATNGFIEMVENCHAHVNDTQASDLMEIVLRESGYEEMLRNAGDWDRLENLAALKQAVNEFEVDNDHESTLQDFLDHVALCSNADSKDTDAVKLMTVHTSKGMEFPFVFVCELSEGVFPSRRTTTRREMEEERRIAYVAFTRAKEKLFLSNSDGMDLSGGFKYPSRFIFNAGERDLGYVAAIPAEIKDYAQRFIADNEEFLDRGLAEGLPAGTRVNHTQFGEGTILSYETEKHSYSVQFDSQSTPRTFSVPTQALSQV